MVTRKAGNHRVKAMREDVLEYLEAAFPDGFMLVYMRPGGSCITWLQNLKGSTELSEAFKLLYPEPKKKKTPDDFNDSDMLGGNF
jgi:hypothetical protein